MNLPTERAGRRGESPQPTALEAPTEPHGGPERSREASPSRPRSVRRGPGLAWPEPGGLLCLALLLAAATLQSGEREGSCAALAIVDRADGVALGAWPLRPGETVAYAYVHTAEGLPAEELLALEADGQLHVVASSSPQHGAGHLPEETLSPSRTRPGWQEARVGPGPALTPFAVFTGERRLGDPRLLWRGHTVALAGLHPRRHVEWRVESRCR